METKFSLEQMNKILDFMDRNYTAIGDDEIDNVIYKTYDYSKFTGTFDNRIDINEEPNTKGYLELKNSIARYGNLEEITVRAEGNKFIIVEGHHRYVACKSLGLPIRYKINNDMTLDMALEMSRTTIKWSETDLYKRGLVNEVPLCLLVKDILEANDRLTENSAIKLVWIYLKGVNKKYPSIDVLRKKLKLEQAIEKLKEIEIEAKDVEKLKLFIARYLEIISVSKSTKNVRDNVIDESFATLSITNETIHGFAKTYNKYIEGYYDSWLKSWKKVCRCKTKADKEIYNKITSGKERQVKKGIKDITTNIVFE